MWFFRRRSQNRFPPTARCQPCGPAGSTKPSGTPHRRNRSQTSSRIRLRWRRFRVPRRNSTNRRRCRRSRVGLYRSRPWQCSSLPRLLPSSPLAHRRLLRWRHRPRKQPEAEHTGSARASSRLAFHWVTVSVKTAPTVHLETPIHNWHWWRYRILAPRPPPHRRS